MLPLEQVLGDSVLTRADGKVRLDIRLPWYRALPLSTIEIESLAIDHAAVPIEALRFELNGSTWTLEELKELTDTFWFVLDSAYLLLSEDVLRAGSSHVVALSLIIYPPYIPGLRRVTKQTQTVTVQ